MKNSLKATGLSLSQAQSISNLCYQEAQEIASKIAQINNVEKTINIDGKVYIDTKCVKMPENIVDMIKHQALLHSTQAFLMENIKAKDKMLNELQYKSFKYETEAPKHPRMEEVKHLLPVNEDWGWNQLSEAEINEFLECQAYASHIGQFIHKDGKLTKLRNELPTLKTLEWIIIKDGEKTPMEVEIHHTSEQLLTIHNDLAALHRKHEQRVNYFKAKVKNLVTEENAKIANINAKEEAEVNSRNQTLIDEFRQNSEQYRSEYQVELQKFENWRQEEIKRIAALRIDVDSRFQVIIDKFLTAN